MLEKQQLRELIQLTQEEMGLIQDQLNDSLEETRVANAKILVASKDNSTLETSLQELATAFRCKLRIKISYLNPRNPSPLFFFSVARTLGFRNLFSSVFPN